MLRLKQRAVMAYKVSHLEVKTITKMFVTGLTWYAITALYSNFLTCKQWEDTVLPYAG